ncbi:MAG: hypothetical protein ACKOQM_12535 [Novosphingobium sp.]
MNENAFLAIFHFLFIGMWLSVTAFMAAFSGIGELARRYPDRPEQQPWRTLRFQSGQIGRFMVTGVNYGSCLRFDVCPAGLRIRIWRLFAPFSAPCLVPWDAISVEKRPIFSLPFTFARRYRLSFGNPPLGPLSISGRAARRIAEASNGLFRLPEEP